MANKNDTAWNKLFPRHNILQEIAQNGVCEITADQIKVEREPRLMTKFDHAIQRPDIFKQNDLNIQPTARGSYIIGRFENYFTMPKPTNRTIEIFSLPNFIQTIVPDQITSEAISILCAHHGGLFSEVMGEDSALTIMGRMGTGVFNYQIAQKGGAPYPISVQKSQCEVDGGFEGLTTLALVEAKSHACDDFLIRQLYYPYRLWQGKTTKSVVPIFMTHSDGVFSFYKFEFTDDQLYNSLVLQEVRHFQFGTIGIAMEDIVRIHHAITPANEPPITFPQANSMARLIDLLWQLDAAGGQLDNDEITGLQDFDKRQANYYADAGRYLGLIEKVRDGVYQLSQTGRAVLVMTHQNRSLEMVRLILSHKVFYDAFGLYINNGTLPDQSTVAALIDNTRAELSGNTPHRRASTVLSWLGWILELPTR